METPLEITDLIQLHDSAFPTFSEIWEEGEDNERRRISKNWSKELEQRHRNQGRQSFSMPIMLSKLDRIAALQKQGKREWRVNATIDPQDEIKAEIASIRMRDIANRSKWNFLQSEIFESGLFIKFGATKIVQDFDKYGQPEIKLKRVDWKNIMWDVNSKEYNVREDALWMSEIEKVYRVNLAQEYPEIVTNKISDGELTSFKGRDTINYYVQRNMNGQQDYDVISKFTHYQKANRKYHCVIFEDPANLYSSANGIIYKEFRSKKEAEQFLRKLNIPYIAQGQPFQGDIQVKEKVMLDKYVFVYNQILEFEETDIELFPYDLFFGIRFEDNFISMMDMMKDPQIIIDRMWSQIDYFIGQDIKKVNQVYTDFLDDRITYEDFTEIMAKGGNVPVKGTPGQDVVRQVQGSGANPQFLQISQIMQSYLEDIGGGRSFQGLSEGAESGKAIRLKQAQGMLVAFNLINNFSRYMQNVGENLLYNMQKFDTAQAVIRVAGARLSEEMLQLLSKNGIFSPSQTGAGGYVKVNDPSNELTIFQDADFELSVMEAELSDEARIMKRQQMLEALQVMPELNTRTFKEELLRTFENLDYSTTQKILQEADEIAQQAQLQQQQEMNLEKAKIVSQMPMSQMPQSQQ